MIPLLLLMKVNLEVRVYRRLLGLLHRYTENGRGS
jgi:hypothetical protein